MSDLVGNSEDRFSHDAAQTITVCATKSGRDLPLYEIGLLLKIGGTGSYYDCLLQNPNICILALQKVTN